MTKIKLLVVICIGFIFGLIYSLSCNTGSSAMADEGINNNSVIVKTREVIYLVPSYKWNGGVVDLYGQCYQEIADGKRDMSECCPEGFEAVGFSAQSEDVMNLVCLELEE